MPELVKIGGSPMRLLTLIGHAQGRNQRFQSAGVSTALTFRKLLT